jgi:hypothetical protein
MQTCGAETRIGDKVRFMGATTDQVRWGGGSDPTGVMVIGQVLTVIGVDAHKWHTDLTFEGVVGRFNSVMFAPYVSPTLSRAEAEAHLQHMSETRPHKDGAACRVIIGELARLRSIIDGLCTIVRES